MRMEDSAQSLKDIGESKAIEIIESIIFEITGKTLRKDDAFFVDLETLGIDREQNLVLNTDMLINTTDAPPQMTHYQIGRKSIIMNISDLLVKGVKPIAIIISLGLPNELSISNFKELIKGIVDVCKTFNIDYIGGDINESTQDIIINPTLLGFGQKFKIIPRKGLKTGDIICINGDFGLTGIGFNILLKKIGDINDPKYTLAIDSVLNPSVKSAEAYLLAQNELATASIDSSDGLAKSLKDLSIANDDVGFEINFEDIPIKDIVKEYSKENNIPLERLIFNAGEEFIHLFAINPNYLDKAKKIIKDQKGMLVPIGKVIEEKQIRIIKNNKRIILEEFGYEHFITTQKRN